MGRSPSLLWSTSCTRGGKQLVACWMDRGERELGRDFSKTPDAMSAIDCDYAHLLVPAQSAAQSELDPIRRVDDAQRTVLCFTADGGLGEGVT